MKLKRLLMGSAALACAALTACGTAASTAAATGAGAPAHVVAATKLTPQQQAKADAAAMLAAFVPPPGARRLSSAPTGSGGVLKHKAFTVGVANQLDDVSFWRVPASAASVLNYEKAHLPRQFKLTSWGSVGDTYGTPPKPGHPLRGPSQPHPIGNTYGAWYDQWSLPGVPGVIDLRDLTVELTDPSSSVTYVRIDSNVAWIPPRPATEKVPAGVKVVTITASPDANHPKGTPAPVTVTSPAKVAQIVALLDGLSLKTSSTFSCPMEQGEGITLSFRAKPGGPVLATASEWIPSCGSVNFTIGRVRQPTLADWGSFTTKVLAIAGAHWPTWYI
ncbi:MAG: hypothetical protein JWM19_2033 [Actinomycetia bacterium]|nr:hypothetical protein [Actinomycetes bacterium]